MMQERKQSRFLCLFLAFLLAGFSFFICRNAASAADMSAANIAAPVVYTFNIGISPKDYQTLISDESEPVFSVPFSVDEGALLLGEIKLRGSGSKTLGLVFPTKRIPVQFKFKKTIPLKETINNSCIKLINSITPYGLLAEYIAFDLFAFCGIPTPAHEFVFLRYNDVDFGLYLAVEDINKQFLVNHFLSPSGMLLKCTKADTRLPFACNSLWFGNLYTAYEGGHQRFLALTDALDRGKGYEEYLDIDEVLRFFACTAAYGAEDSILTAPNNYYLYDTGEKFVLLPWDLSEAFSAKKTGSGINSFQSGPGCSSPSALFDLLMREEQNRAKYHAYLQEINDRFLAPEIMEPYLQSLAALVAPFLSRDVTMVFDLPYETSVTPDEGYDPIGFLLFTLTKIHENLAEQLNGSAHVFYANSTNDKALSPEEVNRRIEYLIQNSPTIDPDITDHICENYSAYCRKMGIVQIGVNDPLETAAAAIVFAVSFLVIAALTRQKSRKTIPKGEQDR